jgi:molybdopterin synthase sulfur carrier subunit
MRILTFGIVKEITGSPSISIVLPPQATVTELMQHLKGLYPELNRLKSLALAINGAYAASDSIITPGDELALIPPVSGG